jgi:hypothetical protein
MHSCTAPTFKSAPCRGRSSTAVRASSRSDPQGLEDELNDELGGVLKHASAPERRSKCKTPFRVTGRRFLHDYRLAVERPDDVALSSGVWGAATAIVGAIGAMTVVTGVSS